MSKIPSSPSTEETTVVGKHYTSKQLAKLLGITISCLSKLRLSGKGPKYVKFGYRNILYPDAEVGKYLKEHLRASTSDTGGHHD